MKTVTLVNESGNIKIRKIGFSWTTFFFLFFPALFRKDWKWFSILLGLWVVYAVIVTYIPGRSITMVGFILSLFAGLSYNKLNIAGLLKQGYRPETKEMEDAMKERNYMHFDQTYFMDKENAAGKDSGL